MYSDKSSRNGSLQRNPKDMPDQTPLPTGYKSMEQIYFCERLNSASKKRSKRGFFRVMPTGAMFGHLKNLSVDVGV